MGRGSKYGTKKIITNKNVHPDVERARENVGKILKRAVEYGESMAWYALYKALPYPMCAIVFIYWQKGVTIVAFLVIPTLIAIWATFHALGNRNYFSTNPKEYEESSIAEGPAEYDSEEDEDEYSSEYESEPLHSRKATMSQITVVQADYPNSRRNNRNV